MISKLLVLQVVKLGGCFRRERYSAASKFRRVASLFVLCVLTFVLPINAGAEGDYEYFRADVKVKNQDLGERRRAAEEGLREVLLRVSGAEDVLENLTVQAQLKRASQLVEQFQYVALSEDETNNRAGDSSGASSDSGEYSEIVSFKFSSFLIEKLLMDAGQMFWPVNRPSTLLWLVEDNVDLGKQLVNGQSGGELIQAIEASARRRGLPINYPLLDLEDQLSLSAEQVWGLDEQAVLQASARYRADVILVGRYTVTSAGELWTTWQFFHAGEARLYDSRSSAIEDRFIEDVAQDAISPLANFLANRYSIIPQAESEPRLLVQIAGIQNFDDYRGALNYLEGLAAISDVGLLAVKQDTLLLDVKSESSLDRLLGTFELEKRLVPHGANSQLPIWQQARRGSEENPLKFHWTGRP